MDPKSRKAFPFFILFFATVFGLVVRLGPAMLIDGPINDGGMFYQMVRDLQANAYRLPMTLSYNHLGIPFAYPPFGFYLTALVQVAVHADLYDVFRFWPGIASTLSVPAFYFLAVAVLRDRTRAAVASAFYALSPASFYLPFMGGGVVRAPALVFSLLALGCFYRLFETREWRLVWPAAGLMALTALTHPETIFHTVISVAVFWACVGRTRRSLVQTLAAAGGTLAAASPWWLAMLGRYGFAPFATALSGSLRDNLAPLYLIQFNLTGEALLTVVGVLAAVGLVCVVHRKEWLLPVWIAVSFLTSWRASPFSAIFPVAMLGAMGLERLVGETPEPFAALYASPAKRNVLLLLLAYNLMGGLWAATGIAYEQRLVPAERSSLSRVANLTPPDSRFLVITGASAPGDALAEWFPALTQRTSVATAQGHEWTASPNVTQAYWQASDLQACVDQTIQCLQDWAQRYAVAYQYVYIRRIRTTRSGQILQIDTVLEMSIQQSGAYNMIDQSDVGALYERK